MWSVKSLLDKEVPGCSGEPSPTATGNRISIVIARKYPPKNPRAFWIIPDFV
jgi:hypothetical protein